MLVKARNIVYAAVLLPFVLRAEPAVDPSGHWEGAIHTPAADIAVAVDLAFDDDRLVGTFSNPSQKIFGFPLASAAADGRAVKLELKTSDAGVQTFNGNLSEDGASMSGELLISVYAVPFTLVRIGEATIAAAPRSPAMDAALAGEWQGSLELGGRRLPVKLTMTNDTDRTSYGTWSSGGGTATPVTIASDGRSVTLASAVTEARYTGTLNADGTEINGALLEGGSSLALTFTRAR